MSRSHLCQLAHHAEGPFLPGCQVRRTPEKNRAQEHGLAPEVLVIVSSSSSSSSSSSRRGGGGGSSSSSRRSSSRSSSVVVV